MVKKPTIGIGSPCTENWANMTPDAQGRFCDKCALTVRDVTYWSDEQLLQEYEKHDGNLCIRMPESRHRSIDSRSGRRSFVSFAAVLIAFFHWAKKGVASTMPWVDSMKQSEDSTKKSINRMIVLGKVADSVEHNQPLIGAHIKLIKNGKPFVNLISDVEGRFECTLEELNENDTVSIQVDYLGYETLHDTLVIQDTVKCDLYMNESFVCLNEAVKVVSRKEIRQGGAFMGISIRYDKIPVRRIYKFDEYDTKTYHHEDLQRYNFGRD